MSIRDLLAKRASGGTEFRVLPDRMLVEVGEDNTLSKVARGNNEDIPRVLESPPVGSNELSRLHTTLEDLGSSVTQLQNTGVLVIEVKRMDEFINNIMENSELFSPDFPELESLVEQAKEGSPDTIIGGFGPGVFNFGNGIDDTEAYLRNELMDKSLTNPLTEALEGLNMVSSAQMSRTLTTFGPRNLSVDPLSELNQVLEDDDTSQLTDLGDVSDKLDLEDVWEVDSGSSAVCAIFDTSFCEETFDNSRIIDTFSGPDVDSAFSDPSEGHGTMTAYCAAGNEDGSQYDYSGIAKDSDIILVRLSDPTGSLVYMPEAWDWFIGKIKELDRPVISNHSYGMPVCTGRPFNTCNGLVADMARAANKRIDHQAFYAAGNSARYCGHRLSGITNGINGPNSHPESLTSAAFRFDLRDAQRYSSHGYGTCNDSDSNPKPDFGFLLPDLFPYGCEETDMSSTGGGSTGGTSAASPLCAGVATIISSITGTAKRSVIEDIMEQTAELPRTTQINIVEGKDARFGNGQVMPLDAIQMAEDMEIEPTAAFSVSQSVVSVGETVEFDASSTQTGDSEIVSYSWDLGGGDTGSGKIVSKTYTGIGKVDVELTVKDNRGDVDSQTRTITVVDSKPE